nr:hypothetical protein [Torque teno midi virus]
MPFWWRRRRKFWWGKGYRRPTYKRRYKRRKLYRRRRPFRTTRRRRGRRRYRKRKKVRRKKQTIPVRQWQPDCIRLAKIKGAGVAVLGAEGKQMMCYTDHKTDPTPAKAPFGGGFGVQRFTLQFLYEEHLNNNNFWTASNLYLDLCRYLRCRFTFYRHLHTDFIINYDRSPPFEFGKYTYPSTHPHVLLQSRHKKILFSKKTKENGRNKLRIYIKPPRQMISKWFFSKTFTEMPLCLIKTAAMNVNFAYLGCCNKNQELSIFYLNQKFYLNANWGAQSTEPYKPYDKTAPKYTITYTDGKTDKTETWEAPKNYNDSIDIDKGWFNSKLMRAKEIKYNETKYAVTPTNVARYNPNLDDGKGNKIYLTSTLSKSYDPPTHDKTILIEELPLWLGLYGFLSYVLKIKQDKTFLDSHCVMIKSKAILPYSQIGAYGYYLPLDQTFINGKAPYDEYLTTTMKAKWFPTVKNQMETLNAFVNCGPYIPKYADNRESNWELKYTYDFYFKFGGPQMSDKQVADPKTQKTYIVPDTVYSNVQVQNPLKQATESLLHDWDIRRGMFTRTALKRMQENLSIDTDFLTDQEEDVPKKKKRLGDAMPAPQEEIKEIKSCLQKLSEENIYQEQTDQELQQYIMFQQQQQQELKLNLLKLIQDLKQKQAELQLHTGVVL